MKRFYKIHPLLLLAGLAVQRVRRFLPLTGLREVLVVTVVPLSHRRRHTLKLIY
jgi:hypothetical protein